MKENITLKELVNYFLNLEKEEGLLDFEINGVKIWQYLRFRIFMMIATKSGLYQEGHSKNISFKYLVKRAPSLLFYSLFSNPLLGFYRRKNLFFNAGRIVDVDGEKVDIYTKYFIEKEGIVDYEIIEEMVEFRHLRFILKNRKHQDAQQIVAFLYSTFSNFQLNKDQREKIQTIQNRIKNDLGLVLNTEKLFRNSYLTFKSDEHFYSKLIRKRKPEKIFIICSYGYKMALVAAARKLKVETIELQHGTVTPYHIGYVYPDGAQPCYFPDKFYAFGNFWKNTSKLPLKDEAIVVKGFPYFSFIKEKYANILPKRNQLLIISQGNIGYHLSSLFAESIALFSDYQIIYKLHPGEYSRWKAEYPQLLEISQLANVEVIDHNNVNLYHYFAESNFVIGVFSTAIYEAIGFGCNVYLLKLPGIEYLENLQGTNLAKIGNSFQEIAEWLKEPVSRRENFEIFAE